MPGYCIVIWRGGKQYCFIRQGGETVAVGEEVALSRPYHVRVGEDGTLYFFNTNVQMQDLDFHQIEPLHTVQVVVQGAYDSIFVGPRFMSIEGVDVCKTDWKLEAKNVYPGALTHCLTDECQNVVTFMDEKTYNILLPIAQKLSSIGVMPRLLKHGLCSRIKEGKVEEAKVEKEHKLAGYFIHPKMKLLTDFNKEMVLNEPEKDMLFQELTRLIRASHAKKITHGLDLDVRNIGIEGTFPKSRYRLYLLTLHTEQTFDYSGPVIERGDNNFRRDVTVDHEEIYDVVQYFRGKPYREENKKGKFEIKK